LAQTLAEQLVNLLQVLQALKAKRFYNQVEEARFIFRAFFMAK